jgi:hypothetical protein
MDTYSLLHHEKDKTATDCDLVTGELWNGHFRRISFFFIAYLFLIIVLTVKETTTWTHASYLPKTPQLVLSVSLILLWGTANISEILYAKQIST